MDVGSWSLGLSLIVLTIAIHTTAVVGMAIGLKTIVTGRTGAQEPTRRQAISFVIIRIGTIAVLLAALHGVEGVIWAAAYRWLGIFEHFADASAFSLAAMTTSETSAVPTASQWQMLSALEAVNGGLLFGTSTAFLFAVIQFHWQLLLHRRDHSSDR